MGDQLHSLGALTDFFTSSGLIASLSILSEKCRPVCVDGETKGAANDRSPFLFDLVMKF
jgi:hypothetical protein